MQLIHQLALIAHIGLGAIALIIFWVPVFAKKGSIDHRRFGRYFGFSMYIIAYSGLVMSSLDLLMPLQMHGDGQPISLALADEMVAGIRSFALFLLSLSLLVLSSTRQGWLVMLHKQDRSALRTPIHTALCISVAVAGVVLLVVGINTGNILFMAFSVLEIITGLSALRYNFKTQLDDKQWWFEHLKGLIASGIGAYTAFFVFGGTRILVQLFGNAFDTLSIFLWISPSLIGSIGIALASRHYKIRFSGEWAASRAKQRAALFES